MTRRQINAIRKQVQKKIDAALANRETLTALYEKACDSDDSDAINFYFVKREELDAQVRELEQQFPCEEEFSWTQYLISNNCD